MSARHLAALSTFELAALLEAGAVVLVPSGSVEPHGPHLPLGTDATLSEEVARRAAIALESQGIVAVVAPGLPYGVTEFGRGFAGAIGLSAPVVEALVRELAGRLIEDGFAHVCFVNSHLEPAHEAALRAGIAGLPRASVASPLEKRWGRTLSAEFKSGACHAGRYETSLVLAAAPAAAQDAVIARAAALPARAESLSEAISLGASSFLSLGLDRAYTGAPAEATAAEGHALYALLATMVVTTVRERLATSGPGADAPTA